jgi:hypothetical protein
MPQSSAAVNRLTLLPTAREPRALGGPRVRRYRLARVAMPMPAVGGETRYAYLKRTYD